jgi:hypothetical protein
MKFVTQEADGTLVIDSEFFDQYLDINDMVQLTLTIERRNGQINIMNPKVSRNGLTKEIKETGISPRTKKGS